MKPVLSALLTLALALTVVVPPAAADDVDIDRVSGTTRFGTSAAVADAFFDDVDEVWLATGQAFPDALAAGAAAAATGAPVLTTPTAVLDDDVRAQLIRLDPATVRIAGGPNAVSRAVADAVADALDDAEVVRVAGDGRYETAAEIFATAFGDGVDTVYLATGRNFADALAAAPAAAAEGAGLLLTDPEVLLPEVADALAAAEPANLVIVGGTNAVSEAVADAAADAAGGADTERVAGAERFATGAALAARAGIGEHLLVASGLDFADALAAGPAAASLGSAVVLVGDATVPPPSFDVIAESTPRRITVIGGRLAVTDPVLEVLRAAATGDEPPPPAPTRVAYTAIQRVDGPRDSSVRVVGLDGSGDRVLVQGSAGNIAEVRASAADGALVLERGAAFSDVRLVILDGSGQQVGTWPQDGGCVYTSAAFSPDGQTIMAACQAGHQGSARMVPIDRSGAEVGPVSHFDTLRDTISWRADGGAVAFAVSTGTETAAVTRTVDAANLRTVAPGAQSASFAPSGSAIAVVRDADVAVIDGDTEKVLVQAPPAGIDPVWTPDGASVVVTVLRDGAKQLVKLSLGGDETILASATGETDLIARAATTRDVIVAEAVHPEFAGPDGRILAVALDGSGSRSLTDTTATMDDDPVLMP